MVKRKNRLLTDALREIRRTFNRYLSILVLSALAVAFLSGLRATAPDMKYTADNYYDRTNLMDGWVISTLGLTQGDLDALEAAEGVERVEGVWTVDATAVDHIVSVRSMPRELNLLEVKRGRLPQAADECVTEGRLLVELGIDVGDTLTLTMDPDNEGDLVHTAYTIVGVVNCPLYVGTDRGTSALGSGSVDAFVFVPGENFTYDYFTAAYLTGEGFSALDSYGDEYEQRAEDLLDSLEPLGEERSTLRHDSLVGDAQEELDDAQEEVDQARADADRELADAWQELEDARKKLDDGWAELEDGREKLHQENADASAELAEAYTKLQDAIGEYHDGQSKYDQSAGEVEDGLKEIEDQQQELYRQRAELDGRQAELNEGKRALQDQQAELDAQRAALAEQRAELEAGLAQYEAAVSAFPDGSAEQAAVIAQLAEQKAQLDGGMAQVEAGQAQLDAGAQQVEAALAQLEAGQAQLDEGAAQLDDGQRQINEAREELQAGLEELGSAKTELDDAWAQILQGQADYRQGTADLDEAIAEARQELDDAQAELEDGEREYADGLKEYEDGKAEADEKIAEAQQKLDDAREELDKVEECEWYILGRYANAGFVGFDQDTQRVSNLATIFPVIFFLVAALACLTTMTRMVEEQRTEIGALKAMGFSRLAISRKYIGYAFSASLIGGVLGLAVGCTLIPAVIANAFNIMYAMPKLQFREQTVLCVLSVLAAVACTTGAALWACLSTLIATPASLMRPRAPKAGRRVLLERVGPIWRRLSFTWKVTVRNLFRYKRRFWMTVVGIGGCTALIVTGFGLHESIFDILDKQFDEISLYDANVGLDEDAPAEDLAQVEDYLDGEPGVARWMTARQTLLEVSAGGRAYDAYLMTVPEQEEFEQFVDLRHRKDSQPVDLQPEGVVITEKLSELLDVEVGGTITLDGDKRVEAVVTDIVENYVYHYVYLTEGCYEALFGEEPVDNVLLLAYADGAGAGQSNTISARLMAMDAVESYSYFATLRDNFTSSMRAIDYAVVIIIVSAAALAFVVLYNLTNINITERMRELATLKVLGFYDREVTAYVYRENFFLTIFGILLGLVMGRLLHAWMVLTVEVDLVMFGRTAPPYAYVLAAVLTVVFAVTVNIAAHFSMKKIDMVESLKTVE